LPLQLKPSSRIPLSPGPVVLVVMDGVGVGSGDDGDAVALARTPVLDFLTGASAYRHLRASGTAVGLPTDEDMGNSEVGHNAMGAGRIFDQGARLVNRAIETGEIFRTPVWKKIEERSAKGGALHLIGLLSDGNVHSHELHLYALLRGADRSGIKDVYVHILLDGRDVAETSALIYVDRLEKMLAEVNAKSDRGYRIASGGGRMTTTMDRYENDWGMVERGWNAQVHGEGRQFGSAREAIETLRSETPGLIDQYLPSFVLAENGKPVGPMKDGDSVILFNYRGDRAIEVSRAFDEGPEFNKFDRGPIPDLYFAGMTLYDGEYQIPKTYLVSPPSIDRTMSEYLAAMRVPQFVVSETQKFGHMTYFWNGNRGGMFDQKTETYLEVPSDRVPFDQRPWMKAAEIADAMLDALKGNKHRFLRLNFANGDMVGHTGQLLPTVVAMEALDLALGRLLSGVRAANATLVVTADHGNAEDMVERDKQGGPLRREDGSMKGKTSHTTNPVGIWIHRPQGPQPGLRRDLPDAGLANLASTLLELLGFAPPEDYLPSLIE
jgi:2,3-bisphosphoglycerate-independent phosphoglycerate mutase